MPLFGCGVVEARGCRNVLVEGAASVHVDELEAPADAYRRQREVDGRLQDRTLVVVTQRLRWKGIGLRPVAVPGWIDVGSSREQHAVQVVHEVDRVHVEGEEYGHPARLQHATSIGGVEDVYGEVGEDVRAGALNQLGGGRGRS